MSGIICCCLQCRRLILVSYFSQHLGGHDRDAAERERTRAQGTVDRSWTARLHNDTPEPDVPLDAVPSLPPPEPGSLGAPGGRGWMSPSVGNPLYAITTIPIDHERGRRCK